MLEHYKDIIVISGDIDQDQISCQQNTGLDLDCFISPGSLTVWAKTPTDSFTWLHDCVETDTNSFQDEYWQFFYVLFQQILNVC